MIRPAKLKAARCVHDILQSPYVVLDLETTTTDFNDLAGDEIVQIGIVNQDGETLLDSYIRPVRRIPNSHYHGITDEMVAGAPTYPELHDQIVSLIADKVVVIYNAGYDTNIVVGVMQQHNLPGFSFGSECHCAMELYAAFYGDWSDYHGSFKFQKLEAAMERFGLKWEGHAHNALADAKATVQVMKAMDAWYQQHAVEVR